MRPTLTPSGRLTAGRRCLTAVEGSECRDRRRCGAHAAAAGANSTGGPAGGCGSRLGAATRRPHAGPSIASRQDAGVADRAEPAALGNGVDGHFSDFLGGTLRCTGGFGRPSGGRCETDSDAEWSADGQAVVPDGRGGSECRDRRRDGAHAAAAATAHRAWQQRSIPPRSWRRAGADQAAVERPARCCRSYGVRSRSIEQATASNRSETVRSARPLALATRSQRPHSGPSHRIVLDSRIASRAQ